MGKTAFIFSFSESQTPESFHQVLHASAGFNIFQPHSDLKIINRRWMDEQVFIQCKTQDWNSEVIAKISKREKNFRPSWKLFGIEGEGGKLNGMYNKLAASVNLRNNLWRNKNFNLDFQLFEICVYLFFVCSCNFFQTYSLDVNTNRLGVFRISFW